MAEEKVTYEDELPLIEINFKMDVARIKKANSVKTIMMANAGDMQHIIELLSTCVWDTEQERFMHREKAKSIVEEMSFDQLETVLLEVMETLNRDAGVSKKPSA